MGLKSKTVKLLAIVLLACGFPNKSITASALELIERKNDLIVVYKGDTISLKDVLTPEVSAYYEIFSESSFFIVYEYYASRNKLQIKYSLQLKEGRVFVNKVLYFFYDDMEGIPFGWICLTNKEFDSLNSSLDELITLNVEFEMKMDSQKDESYQIELTPYGDSQIFYFKASKNEDSIEINVPLFYEDGSFVGNGKFHYKANEWHELSMNFPISFFESDYFIFNQEVSKDNARHFNDMAFFLEQGHNFTEAIIILEKIIDKVPSRTVAYINLGDAYWGQNEFEKAKDAYERYVDLMTMSGKENRIPMRVPDRLFAGY